MAGEQEVGFKLKADTGEAIKSVKDFERTVQGIERVQKKGVGEEGFLSKKDVEQFKRMSKEAENVYNNFFKQYSRLQSEFERKKAELVRASEQNADMGQIKQLKADIRQLEARKNQMSKQVGQVQGLNRRSTVAGEQIGGMRTESAGTTILGGGMNGIVGGLMTMVGIGAATNYVRQGMGKVKSEEEFMAQLGTRMGGYNGNFQQARIDAMETGLQNNYKAMETMRLAEQYTSIAGSTSSKSTWEAIQQIQGSSRALGVDANVLAQTGGTLQKLGALDATQQRQFAQLLAGAIKKEGMAGRDREMIDAVQSLSQQAVQGQVSLSNSELRNIVGLETLLGSREEGFKGQRGANLLANLDSSIKNGGQAVDLLLGWGTKYQGVEGRYQLEMQKAQGVAENLPTILKMLPKMSGGNRHRGALILQNQFGIGIEQASRILQPDIRSAIVSGDYGTEQIKSILDAGGKKLTAQGEAYAGSEAATRASIDAKQEMVQKKAGETADAVIKPFMDAFTDMNPWAQLGIMGAGTVGMGLGSGLLLSGASKIGKRFLGKRVDGTRGGGFGGGGFWGNFGSKSSRERRMTTDRPDIGSRFDRRRGATFSKSAEEAEEALSRSGRKSGSFLGKLGKFGKYGKKIPYLGMAVSALSLGSAVMSGDEEKIGGSLGSIGGGWGGAAAGAAIGSLIFPGVGTVVGGILGGIGGSIGGGKLGNWVGGLFGKDGVSKSKQEAITQMNYDPSKGYNLTTTPYKPDQGYNLTTLSYGGEQNLTKQEELINKKFAFLEKERINISNRQNNIDNLMKVYGIDGSLSTKGTSNSSGLLSGNPFASTIMNGMLQLAFNPIGGMANMAGGLMNLAFGGGNGGPGVSTVGPSSLSAADINRWIASKAPNDSFLRGKGGTFLRASRESGLKAKFLVALAAHETGWGTNRIGREKGNVYSIGAFDASPYASAYGYNNVNAGIVEGAEWIAKHYAKRGQNTVHGMVTGNHQYATDPHWDESIAAIMKGAPQATLNVRVSGGIDGLTNENNAAVAGAIANRFGSPDLAYNFSRGVGGWM